MQNDVYDAVGYAISYLRKLKQHRDGKISLTVPGHDPPFIPDNIESELARMVKLRDDL